MEDTAPKRDSKGRFPKGVSGNPSGRPRRALALRELLDGATTDEKFLNVFESVYQKAISGDMPAAKIFLEYTIGKPTESVEIEGPSGGLTFIVREATKKRDEDEADEG